MDDIQGGEPFVYQGHYISCMKINGVPLLPPLMTQEYRQEMQYYKQLAVAVERRISELKVCLDDTTVYSTNIPSDTEECFDAINMSFDNIPEKSSFIDKPNNQFHMASNDNYFDRDHENNHFESMNSQVTIIDLSSDNFSDFGLVSKQSKDTSVSPGCKTSERRNVEHHMSESNGSCKSLKDKKCPLEYNDEYSKLYSEPAPRLRDSSPNTKAVSKRNGKENDRFNRNKMRFEEHFTTSKQTSNKSFLLAKDTRNQKTSQIYNPPKTTVKKTATGGDLCKNKKITPIKKDQIAKNSPPNSAVKKFANKLYDRTSELIKSRKRLAIVEKNKLSPSKNVTGSLNNISSGLTSPPKLVRQNSYTLEYPSPLLLAHLEVQSITSGVEVGSISMSDSTSMSQLCNIPNKSNKNATNEFWSSIGSDINSLSVNEVSEPRKNSHEVDCKVSKPTCDRKQNSIVSDTKSVHGSTQIFTESPKNQSIPPDMSSKNLNTSSESSQTVRNSDKHSDIQSSVKSFDNDTQMQYDNGNLQNEFENVCVDFGDKASGGKAENIQDASNVCMDYIMKKFHTDHEIQMVALVKKQQEEQLLLQKAFENQQHHLLSQFQNAYATAKSNSSSSKVSRSRDDGKNRADFDSQYNKISRRDDSDTSQRSSVSSIGISNLDGNTEKYLSISADVLNKSRCLLTNRRKVNLSPTNIQCVNVMPTQTGMFHIGNDIDNQRDDRPSSMKSDKVLVRKISYNSEIPDTGRSHNGSSDIKPDKLTNSETRLQLSSRGNDSYSDSINIVYMSDDLADDQLNTSRTSNTIDDLNFTFASDGIQPKNTMYYDNKNDPYMVPINDNKDQDRAAKLKKALTKISEIQKNLASQAMGRSSNRNANYENTDYFQKSKYMPDSDRTISLSSIEVMPYYYSEPLSQRGATDRNTLSLNLTEIHKPSSNRQAASKKQKSPQQLEKEICAASVIVAYTKGYLTRRLMRTERAEATVQTIRDTLYCALQLHRDEGGIQGADVDLHRRLIQQITAACYALHDMFIVYTPEERMSIISQDRERKLMLSHRGSLTGVSPMRQLSATSQRTIRRKLERMSRSHSGVFTNRPTRTVHPQSHVMTRSHYEQSDHMRGGMSDKARRSVAVAGEANSRKPWR